MMRMAALAEICLWSVAVVLLAINAALIISTSVVLIFGSPEAVPASVWKNLVYVGPLFPLLLGALAILRLKVAGDDVWARVGLSRSFLLRDGLIGVVSGLIAIGVAIMCLQIAARHIEIPPMHQFPPSVHIYFMTVGAIVPGVCEELFFRGMMIRVGHRLHEFVVIVLSSAAFSAWHIGTPAYLPHTFVIGLIFGFLTIVTGRLAPSMIAHTVANAGMGVLLLSGFSFAGL